MTQNAGFAIRLKRGLLFVACLSTLAFPLSTRMQAQTVTQVSTGFGFTVFVKSDGSLWGMGDNSQGQLGQGFGLSQTNLPQEILNSNVTAVVAGYYHTLFIESNGSLWAMGLNNNGQLGDGTAVNHYFPEQIVSSEVTRITAGGFHSLFTSVQFVKFLGDEFDFWGMGDNSFGQLGNGTETSYDSPQEFQSTPAFFDAVTTMACGEYHSLYIRGDGSLWTTGLNESGQLGDGTTATHDSFEEIISSNVTAIAGGVAHSLFLKSDGSLWAMGENSLGELGDNSTVDKLSPEQVGVNVTAIAAGNTFSLFIKSDGSLWGMGANGSGQLGDGTGINRYLPVMIVASNVVAVAAGHEQSFFIKSDGSLWAMGDNSYGELGDGTYTTRYFPEQVVPRVIPPVITSISLANTNLILSGTNGESGITYYTLMSTNLALPLNQWSPVAANVLTTDGAFTITATNAVNPNASQAFYVLQAQ